MLIHLFLELAAKENIRPIFTRLYPGTGPRRRELYAKHMEYFAAGKEYLERCLFGGNQTGKTTCGGFEMTAHLTGNYPDFWPGPQVY